MRLALVALSDPWAVRKRSVAVLKLMLKLKNSLPYAQELVRPIQG